MCSIGGGDTETASWIPGVGGLVVRTGNKALPRGVIQMVVAMRRRLRWWRIALFLVGLTVLGAVLPVLNVRNSYCRYCRARRTLRYACLIPLPPSVRENDLSVYWRTVVEAGHKHSWTPVLCGTNVAYNAFGSRMSISCKIIGNPMFGLPPSYELTVLKGLPDNTSRRRFVQAFWRHGENPSQADRRRLERAVMAIIEACGESPRRRDWPDLLHKIGLLPPVTRAP